jgi:hypothetical protein
LAFLLERTVTKSIKKPYFMQKMRLLAVGVRGLPSVILFGGWFNTLKPSLASLTGGLFISALVQAKRLSRSEIKIPSRYGGIGFKVLSG